MIVGASTPPSSPTNSGSASPAIGVTLLLVAAVGAVIGVRRRPELDTPLLIFALLTALAIGSHFRRIERYWFQVNPWVLYFVTVTVVAAVRALVFRRRAPMPQDHRRRMQRIAGAAAAVPLLAIAVAHLVVLPGKVSDAADFNAGGQIQNGPALPNVVQVMDSVVDLTPPDAVIAYYRSRTMTLLTDRRAIQTVDAHLIRDRADYWVQRRNLSFWQPNLDEATARGLGFTEVWSNDLFIIWKTNR